jgi:hypothetical protein
MRLTPTSQFGATATLTLTEAREALNSLHATYCIVPPSAERAMSQRLDAIRTHAESLGIVDVGSLLARANELIRAVTGVDQITAFLTASDADEVHATRNCVAALASAAYVAHGHDPDRAYKALPQLRDRTRSRHRPLEDDEILLCRIHSLHLMAGTTATSRRLAAAYVVADAGVPPTEATAIRCTDIDLGSPEAMMYVPANRTYQERLVPLQQFHSMTLSAHLAALEVSLVTYLPRKNAPGSDAACSSMHGVLGRFLTNLGIVGEDLTAASIYTWRLTEVLRSEGIDAATSFAGRSAQQKHLVLHLCGQTRTALRKLSRTQGFAA